MSELNASAKMLANLQEIIKLIFVYFRPFFMKCEINKQKLGSCTGIKDVICARKKKASLIIFVSPQELGVSHHEKLHLVMILEWSRIDSSHTMTENRQLTAQIKRQGNQETVRCGRADRQERAGWH